MFLCYNKETDKLFHSVHLLARGLCRSHEEKGWQDSGDIAIEETDFVFRIRTNFGYGSKSYMYFIATYRGNELYDFEGSLSPKTMTKFYVPASPDNWYELFSKLEMVYAEKECWNTNSFSRSLLAFDSMDESEYEEDANLIIQHISTLLSESVPTAQTANPLLAPYIKKMCMLGIKIIRNNFTGVGCQKLSGEIGRKGLDIIYNFLKKTNQEQLLFVS